MARTSTLVLAAFLVMPAVDATAQTAENVPSIATMGQASLSRAPDVAYLTIGAEIRAPVPAQAQQQAAEAMTAVQQALGGAGIPADAIRTTGYSLRPDMRYRDNQPTILGYIATNQIEVRVDDLDGLGGVLDAAGRSGSTRISNLRFDLKERADVEQEALALAVADAMARAQAIARGAGASVGPILHIEDQSMVVARPGPVMMRAEAAQAPTPVSPGELEITATVRLTVSIR